MKLQKVREQQKKLSEEDKIESYSEYSKHLNGVTANNSKQESLEVDRNTVLVSSSAASSSSSSGKTENSLPPVYYSLREEEEKRPKSATQIIKQHLQLETTRKRTPLRLTSNKTVPVNVYGVQLPKSADEKRRQFRSQRRNLKSAGDCALMDTDMPSFFAAAAGDGALHKQLFELNHFSRVGKNDLHNQKEPPVEAAISVIDVD